MPVLLPPSFPARAMALGASGAWVAPSEPDVPLAQVVGFSLLEPEDRLPGLGPPTLKEWQRMEWQQGAIPVDHPQVARLVAGRA